MFRQVSNKIPFSLLRGTQRFRNRRPYGPLDKDSVERVTPSVVWTRVDRRVVYVRPDPSVSGVPVNRRKHVTVSVRPRVPIETFEIRVRSFSVTPSTKVPTIFHVQGPDSWSCTGPGDRVNTHPSTVLDPVVGPDPLSKEWRVV